MIVVAQSTPSPSLVSSAEVVVDPATGGDTNSNTMPLFFFPPTATTNGTTSTSTSLQKGPRSTPSSNNNLLPPRPPPTTTTTTIEKTDFPVVQNSTDDDLSFADFSGEDDCDEDQSGCYTNYTSNNNYKTPTSLSGFLETDGVSSSSSGNSTGPYHHHHPAGSFLLRRRRNKVCAIDVASVGNASDTLISVHTGSTSSHKQPNNNNAVSGRDLHETAKMAFNAGNYPQALPLFERILAAQARRFSTAYHPSVGAAMHNVGVCRQRMGENAIAEGLFREAVEIRQRTLGMDHLEVAASLSKLGAALTALQKYDEAMDCLRRALQISSHGGNLKTTAQISCHLACLYFEAGELMASEATFCDALDMYRKVYQETSAAASGTTTNSTNVMLQLADTLCNVGSIQNRRKRFHKSVESFSEALDLQMKIMAQPEDSRIISTLDNLGYSYSKLKDYHSAERCYRKMFRGQVSASQSFPHAAFETFRKLILVLEKLRKYPVAVEETKDAMRLAKSMLPRDHAIVLHLKDLLEDLKQQQHSNRL